MAEDLTEKERVDSPVSQRDGGGGKGPENSVHDFEETILITHSSLFQE